MPSGGQNRGQRSHPLTIEEIQAAYLDKDISMRQAARDLGCGIHVLWRACKDFGIQAKSKVRGIKDGRPVSQERLRDHVWLREQVTTRSLGDIARELGMSRTGLGSYVQRHGLYPAYTSRAEAIQAGMRKMHKPTRKAHQISREDIVREYIDQDINIYQACKILHCSPPTLIESMSFHGIPPKDNQRKIAIPGQHSPRWNGGRIQMQNGYVQIRCPDHPYADKAGNVMEHRLVAEKTLGRYLTREENVHHINRIRNDNRPENLEVLTAAEHRRLHRLEDAHAVQELETQDKKIASLQQRLARYEALYGKLPEQSLPKRTRTRRVDTSQIALFASS